MGIQYDKQKIHWNYFLAIQQDFESLSRYIEFAEENNSTYSIELARIIMSASQEVDVIMKEICSLLINPNADNINDYRDVIKEKLPELISEEVFIARFAMSGKPWSNWEGEENPLWWRANNKIKHQRTQNFHQANLKNAFNALGGLLISNFYYYKIEKELQLGSSVNWKDITSELNCKESFMKLKDDYYRGALLLE